MIQYSAQNITLLDRIRVFRSLGRAHLTQGPAVEKFESGVAEYVGATYAVAVNSATSALHLACLSLGLGAGDIMWTTPISFVASANCGLYCGAEVDFVDIDPETFNMCPLDLEAKLESANLEGRLPKVLVVVHLAGEPAEMRSISTLARKFGVKVIEDASHALGSSYLGSRVGGGQYSEITVFSFHAIKNMTTGEGGMAVTNDSNLAKSMKLLRSHGITREGADFVVNSDNQTPWHYEQQMLGFNFRLTDFQSILGISQLTRIEARNRHRKAILDMYKERLSHLPQIKFQKVATSSQSAVHLAIVQVPQELRGTIVTKLRAAGYLTNLHYFPIHQQPFHRRRISRELPVAEEYGKSALSLPCHDGVTRSIAIQIAEIIECEVLGSQGD